MIQDRLYALALDYKKTKLWKKLWDSELFAVTLASGETGYCCVMGKGGEYVSLALYVGSGVNSYWYIRSARWAESQKEFQEGVFSQDCLQCSFVSRDELAPDELKEARDYAGRNGFAFRGQNAFPMFTSYHPYCYPWHLYNDEEQDLLCQALAAAIEVARRLEGEKKEVLGFRPLRDQGSNRIPLLTHVGGVWNWSMTELPGLAPVQYPRPALTDDVLTARLKKLRRRGDLQCEAVRLPEPVMEEEGDGPPRFPVVLFALDRDNDYLYPCVPILRYEEAPAPLLDAFCRELERQKVLPQTIYVRDERTEALLRDLCSKLKIQLVRQKLLPDLDEVEDEFFNHFDETEDGEIPEEMMEEMFELLSEMDEDMLSTMPPPLMAELGRMLEDGILPNPLAGKVSHLLGLSEEKSQEDNGIILFPGWKGGS